MQKLARRELLRGTGVVALAAGVAVVPFGAMAQSDPELIELWRQWQEALAHVEVTVKEHGRIEEFVWGESAPWWMLKHLPDEKPFVATFERFEQGKPFTMRLPIEAATWDEARDIAAAKQAEFSAERDRTKKAAQRKHKWRAIESATNAAHARHGNLARQISKAKAHSFDGVLVKLALATWLCRSSILDPTHDGDAALLSTAYKAVVALTGGHDLAGEIKAW